MIIIIKTIFVKPSGRMSKPWTSPTPSSKKGGPEAAGSLTNLLPGSQLISSTPHHFTGYASSGLALPTPSTTTTRQSLELFHKNVARYALEPPSRPSITTGLDTFLFCFNSLWRAKLLTTFQCYISRFCFIGFEKQLFHVVSVPAVPIGRWCAG